MKGMGANGQCYYGPKQGTNKGSIRSSERINPQTFGLKRKDLCGIPWRLALALQADGWWLRSEIIWHKPNPMPENVTDRPTKSHEYVFMLTKAARYYYDAEAVKDNVTGNAHARGNGQNPKRRGSASLGVRSNESFPACTIVSSRNLRSVWTIPTQAYSEAHFATYPEKLVEPCVLASTSERGCCPKCGAGWERVIRKTPSTMNIRVRDASKGILGKKSGFDRASVSEKEIAEYGEETPGEAMTIGWRQDCDCGEQATVPATVLDPFNGAGTTGLVALKLGRRYIGIDLNPEYLEMTKRRLAPVLIQPDMLHQERI